MARPYMLRLISLRRLTCLSTSPLHHGSTMAARTAASSCRSLVTKPPRSVLATTDGRSLRIRTLIDEHSRACLGLKVAGRINSVGVIEALAEAMCLHGIPEHIRCVNGPEMISNALRKWVAKTGPQIQYIAPGSPWENGYCESFNGKLRDEC